MSRSSVLAIVKQLIADRGGRYKWKRAVLLDKLQFDVFKWFWLREKPSFSSFFVNSTAHFQHSYWRNMEPDRFEVQPTNPKPDEYENAIAFGYEQMDKLIGKFMKLADRNTTLVFATAISQQPCLKYEEMGGAFFHRSSDFTKFLDFAGIKGYGAVAPVMTHQFHIEFKTSQAAIDAGNILQSFKYDEKTLLQVEVKEDRVFAGCRIYKAVDLENPCYSDLLNKRAPMKQFFYRMETNKSGMHHPTGMLWLRSPSKPPSKNLSSIPLTEAADLILSPLEL
jgi:predicted AlkP superfamily phosphohydrolase/phosphomutase